MTRSRALAALTVALLALPASCGLGEDDDPQAINAQNLPPELLDPDLSSETTEPDPANSSPITIYLIEPEGDSVVLSPVVRAVGDSTRPGDRLGALIDAQPTDDEQAEDLSTSIPADLELLDASEWDQANQLLVINLSQELYDIVGREQIYTFAQLVWTATELAGVRDVRFRVEGQDILARDASGAEKAVVARSDYSALSPR